MLWLWQRVPSYVYVVTTNPTSEKTATITGQAIVYSRMREGEGAGRGGKRRGLGGGGRRGGGGEGWGGGIVWGGAGILPSDLVMRRGWLWLFAGLIMRCFM